MLAPNALAETGRALLAAEAGSAEGTLLGVALPAAIKLRRGALRDGASSD